MTRIKLLHVQIRSCISLNLKLSSLVKGLIDLGWMQRRPLAALGCGPLKSKELSHTELGSPFLTHKEKDYKTHPPVCIICRLKGNYMCKHLKSIKENVKSQKTQLSGDWGSMTHHQEDECGRGKHICKINQPIHLTAVHHEVERVTNCLLWGAGDKPAVCHGTRDPKFSALSSVEYFEMPQKDMGIKSCNWMLNVSQPGHWSKWNIQRHNGHMPSSTQIPDSSMKGGNWGSAELSYYFHPGVWQLPDMWAVGCLYLLKQWISGLAQGWRSHTWKAMELEVWGLMVGDRNGE